MQYTNLNFRITPDLHDELKEAAWSSKLSQSEFVRRALKEAISSTVVPISKVEDHRASRE